MVLEVVSGACEQPGSDDSDSTSLGIDSGMLDIPNSPTTLPYISGEGVFEANTCWASS